MKSVFPRLRSLSRLALLGAVCLVPGLAARGQATGGDGTLFVATTGNDQWSGLLAAPNNHQTDGPLATLEHAVQAIRQRKAAGQPASRILIRAGTYFLNHTLELEPGDSGTAEHPLLMAAYSGEQPVLEGGERLAGTWQKAGPGPLWTLQLRDASHPVEDLFLNGQRQPRAG